MRNKRVHYCAVRASKESCAYDDEAPDDAPVTSPNDVTFDHQSQLMTSSLLLLRPDDVTVTSSYADDADAWIGGLQEDASSTPIS